MEIFEILSNPKLFEIILTSSLTLIGAIIIFIASNFIEKMYLQPYFRFKDKLIIIKTNLLFNKNILTDAFHRGSINKIFINEILKIKSSIRKDWAELMSFYSRSIEYKVPSKNEIKKIGENLLFISNSSLIFEADNKQISVTQECLERDKKIEEIIEIIDKYI